MVNLYIVAYNPMNANWIRLKNIAYELKTAHIIGLSGTGRWHQPEFGPCRISKLDRYTLYDWGWAKRTEGINKSCGVAILARRDTFPNACHNNTYSPPAMLQGRAGAVRYKMSNADICHCVAYLAPNVHKQYDTIN